MKFYWWGTCSLVTVLICLYWRVGARLAVCLSIHSGPDLLELAYLSAVETFCHVEMITHPEVLGHWQIQDSMGKERRRAVVSDYSHKASVDSLRAIELSRTVSHSFEKKFYRTVIWCRGHLGAKKSKSQDPQQSESVEGKGSGQTGHVRVTIELCNLNYYNKFYFSVSKWVISDIFLTNLDSFEHLVFKIEPWLFYKWHYWTKSKTRPSHYEPVWAHTWESQVRFNTDRHFLVKVQKVQTSHLFCVSYMSDDYYLKFSESMRIMLVP